MDTNGSTTCEVTDQCRAEDPLVILLQLQQAKE